MSGKRTSGEPDVSMGVTADWNDGEPSLDLVGTRRELARALALPERQLDGISRSQLEAALERHREVIHRIDDAEAAASVDELTGALRRGAGFAACEAQLAQARRAGQPVIVVFLDVDGLKVVNDTRGHAAGDNLLRSVVRHLRLHVRPYDTLLRFGGDEFICCISSASLAEQRRRFAVVAAEIADENDGSTVSAGMARLRNSTETVMHLVRRADADLITRRQVSGRR